MTLIGGTYSNTVQRRHKLERLGHCTNCAHAVSIIGYFPPGHTHSVTLAGIALSSDPSLPTPPP